MNKEQLLATLNNFMNERNIGRSDFMVDTSAALVLHGLRETVYDIDIEMSEEMIDKLFPSDRFKRHPMMPPFAAFRIELPNRMDIKPPFGDFTSTIVDGIQCRSIESLKKLKETLVKVCGEERDRVDLENINNYLKGMSK